MVVSDGEKCPLLESKGCCWLVTSIVSGSVRQLRQWAAVRRVCGPMRVPLQA
jgi:hypothetical protein